MTVRKRNEFDVGGKGVSDMVPLVSSSLPWLAGV